MVPLMGALTYAEVLDAVRDKFPGSPPFLLKYKDRCDRAQMATVTLHAWADLRQLVEPGGAARCAGRAGSVPACPAGGCSKGC